MHMCQQINYQIKEVYSSDSHIQPNDMGYRALSLRLLCPSTYKLQAYIYCPGKISKKLANIRQKTSGTSME